MRRGYEEGSVRPRIRKRGLFTHGSSPTKGKTKSGETFMIYDRRAASVSWQAAAAAAGYDEARLSHQANVASH